MFFYLFVYGTLKKGFPNSYFLDDAKFLGEAITGKEFSLYVDNLPFMVREKGPGVLGELYLIDKMTLDRIDRLEGHPDFYTREKILVKTDDFIKEAHAYIYYGL